MSMRVLIVCVANLSAAAAVVARDCPFWAGPLFLTARASPALAYDSGRGVTVLFGGGLSAGGQAQFYGETWEWDGTEWALRATDGPPKRSGAAMVYDAGRGVIVLFGGYGLYSDTWEWDGQTWTKRSSDGPSARHSHAMAFDAGRGVTVLFGGEDRQGLSRETWEWDGSSWTKRSTSGPSARYHHAMAYDAGRGVTVLFGGADYNDKFYADTWEWDGSDWTKRSTSGPSAREGSAMAYDPARGVTVLFGGHTFADGGHFYGDTWEWDGSEWTERATDGPPGRDATAMAYHAAREVCVLYGGYHGQNEDDGGYYGDTWEWDGSSWTKRGEDKSTRRAVHTMAYDSARDVLVLFGGVGDSHSGGYYWFHYTGTFEWTAGAPSISQPPQPGDATVGDTVRLSVHAGGAPTYQWRRDGVDLVDGSTGDGSTIRGATTPKLTIENVQRGDAGSYDVVVSNDCGEITTDAATLTIRVRGDLNCDDGVSFNDIDPFVLALISQDEYKNQYPDCDYLLADVNADGSVDLNDVDPFVECLINGGCP
jgi:hypothetical protein